MKRTTKETYIADLLTRVEAAERELSAATRELMKANADALQAHFDSHPLMRREARQERLHQIAHSRLLLLSAVERYQAVYGIGTDRAIRRIADDFGAVSIPGLDEMVYQCITTVGAKTLYRWRTLFKTAGVGALVPGWKGGPPKSEDKDPALASRITLLLHDEPGISAAGLHQRLVTEGFNAPSKRTCERIIQRKRLESP
jgi:hypothetical protein